MNRVTELEADLNHFDPAVRSAALAELLSLVEQGSITWPPATDVVNMHCHTFFSFNAFGHSPTSLAWLGRRHGFKRIGIVDFDVLDGVDEFLDSCEAVGIGGSAGIETRVFVPEYATREINSPGEPGVCYHMGIGFTSSEVPAAVAGILADLNRRATQRYREIVSRVNAYLNPVTIDYEDDVLPLTPAGCPTERHIVQAYIHAAERLASDPAEFWARMLNLEPGQAAGQQPAIGTADQPAEARHPMASIMDDAPQFQNLIRARLMKRGSVGYVQPESGLFPSLEAFHELITACGALPCAAWLDGTSAVEQSMEEWLTFLIDKGVVALNIIPDRNWNVADAETRRLKVRNLHRVVELAQKLDLPLNVGTEMNSFGQKLVDDFDTPELAPVHQAFLDGADFVYGHTVMQRTLGLGYESEWAQTRLPSSRQRCEFYTEVGRAVPPGLTSKARPQHAPFGRRTSSVRQEPQNESPIVRWDESRE